LIGRFLLKFLTAGLICAVLLAFLLSVMQLAGAIEFSDAVVRRLAILGGLLAGLGYGALDWLFGYLPKQKGGRGPDGTRED
jgi:hypothetical protein